ncbi:MAG: nucleotidyltransferase domain-containing protein [Candidatus Nanohaloarchaea archaeon]
MKGTGHEGSDLDIAIFVEESLKPRQLSRIFIELEKLIDKEVDLSVLNDSDVVFQHQVISNGEPVYVDDERERVNFETNVYRRYDDYKHFFDDYNRLRRSVRA